MKYIEHINPSQQLLILLFTDLEMFTGQICLNAVGRFDWLPIHSLIMISSVSEASSRGGPPLRNDQKKAKQHQPPDWLIHHPIIRGSSVFFITPGRLLQLHRAAKEDGKNWFWLNHLEMRESYRFNNDDRNLSQYSSFEIFEPKI